MIVWMMAAGTVTSLAIMAAIMCSLALIFLVVFAPQLVLPDNIWLMIPISAATLALGVFIARSGWSFAKYGSHSGRVSGILLFSIGVIISLVGTGGLLFIFLPWD